MTNATLAEEVAAVLRDSLLHGDFVCGDRLVESMLAREMNVSQNTARDALALLEQDGWVIKQPRRGVFVRSFRTTEVEETFTLLGVMEPLALGWAMQTATPERLANLHGRLAEARERLAADDQRSTLEALRSIHEALVRMTGKPMTVDFVKRLFVYARLIETWRVVQLPMPLPEITALVEAHAVLLNLIDDGNITIAQTHLRQSIDEYATDLLMIVRNLPMPSAT